MSSSETFDSFSGFLIGAGGDMELQASAFSSS
jgi:hypothetical protein